MPISVSVPENTYVDQRIVLGEVEYIFKHTYNTRNERRYLDIYIEDREILSGIMLIEGGQFLLQSYILPDFNHGDLAVIRIKEDGKPATIDNIGIDKAYELMYFTNEELGR